MPVESTPDADPGEYGFGFTIAESVVDRSTRHYEHAVTVSEG